MMARRSSSRGGQAGAFPAALSAEHRGSFRADDAERKAHHPSLHKIPRGARVVLLAGTVVITLLGFAAFALSGSFRQALLSQLRPSSANPSADLALDVDSGAIARGDAQMAEEGNGEVLAAEGEGDSPAEGEGGAEGGGGTEGEQQAEAAQDGEEGTRSNEGRRRKNRGKRRRRRRAVRGDRDKWVTELRKKPSWRIVSGFQGVPATHLIADSNSLACALVVRRACHFWSPIGLPNPSSSSTATAAGTDAADGGAGSDSGGRVTTTTHGHYSGYWYSMDGRDLSLLRSSEDVCGHGTRQLPRPFSPKRFGTTDKYLK